MLLPSSTSLYFTPGTAYQGAFILRVATVAGHGAVSSTSRGSRSPLELRIPGLRNKTTPLDLLAIATTAFEQCLEERPNLPLCQLGAARANAMLKVKAKSQRHYKGLLSTWGAFKGKPARKECATAWREASAAAP